MPPALTGWHLAQPNPGKSITCLVAFAAYSVKARWDLSQKLLMCHAISGLLHVSHRSLSQEANF